MRVSFAVASWLYDWANVALICALIAGAIATVLVVWMGNIKEEYLRSDLAATNERAAKAEARAEESRLALEKFKAPRLLSIEQLAAISAAVSKYSGTALDIFLLGDSPDLPSLAVSLSTALQSVHWQPLTWVWSGVGPFPGAVIVTKHEANETTIAAANALSEALKRTDLSASREDWPAGNWGQFGGMLNGPPFSADRAQIRLVIGSKPQ
jgi:hypothetical protein